MRTVDHESRARALATAGALALALAACVQAPTNGTDAGTGAAEPANGELTTGRARGETSQAGTTMRGAPAKPAAATGATAAGRLDFRTDRPTPRKVALLVGIDEYAPGTPETFPKLSGCVRDVELVAKILVERFGFPSEDVLVLRDAQATHENIVRAFDQWLIGRAGPQTEALFWFSGHGSRVPDQSHAVAAEQGGKDTTFVAFDSRTNDASGAWDVADDEMGSLLWALTRKTQRVTVVTDSCHSGGGTRGAPDRTKPRFRSADEGSRPVDRARLAATIWPKDVPLLDDGDPRAAEPQSYVHIAACSPVQLAQEIDLTGADGKPESHGALTFFLTQCMLAAQPHHSYRRLADETAVRLSSQLPAQTVWYEGALGREIFGSAFEEQPAGFLARSAAAGEIQIDAGTALCLRPDAIVAVYEGSQLVGRARVTRAASTTATARWVDPAPASPPKGALRAVEESRPAKEEPLSLYVLDPTLAATLGKSESVRLAADPAAAEYSLRVEDGGRLALYAPGGLRIHDESARDADWAAKLEKTLREELRYRAVFHLAQEKGTLPVTASFVAPVAEDFDKLHEPGRPSRYAHELAAQPHVQTDHGASAAGSEFHVVGVTDPEKDLSLAILEITNTAGRAAYISVISVAEDRSRNVVYPAARQQDRLLEPGQPLRVPINVVANPRWKDERPMRDRYLVIATTESADFTPLENRAMLRGAAGESPQLPGLIEVATERSQTRGLKSVSTDRTSFGITTVDLLVHRDKSP